MEADQRMNWWARGLHHASDLLIKRGTAMGPLVPLLFLVPVFLGAAWLFRDVLILVGLFAVAAVGLVVEYCRQYAGFAKRDPDRLQSEEYRYGLKRIQMIAAKELPYPVPVDSLALPEPISNPAHPLPPIEDHVTTAEGREPDEESV